jgi:PAS domain S-box-containing protein/diguanylate cyclase (GGDEF)-like protein
MSCRHEITGDVESGMANRSKQALGSSESSAAAGASDPGGERALKILFVEDVGADYELAVRELRRSKIRFVARRVQTAEDFRDALRTFAPDVILSDFGLPAFDGWSALAIARESRPDTPFILVSGTIGEETAVESLKRGAIDYVLKANLTRLSSAVVRAVREQRDHAARRAAETALATSEARNRAIIDTALDCIITIDAAGRVLEFNPASERTFGYARNEVLGKELAELIVPPAQRAAHREGLRRVARGGEARILGRRLELSAMRRDGSEFPVELTVVPIQLPDATMFSAHLRDITERKRAEAGLLEHAKRVAFEADVGAMLARGDTLPEMLQLCCEAIVRHLSASFARIWTLNEHEQVLELQASAGMYTHLDGAHSRVPVGKFKIGLIAQERKPHLTNQVVGDPRVGDQEWAKREGMVAFAGYPLLVGDRLIGVVAMFARQRLAAPTLQSLAEIAGSIALGIERRRAMDQLSESEQRFRLVAERAPDATLIHRDHTIVFVNEAMRQLLGAARAEDIVGRPALSLLPASQLPAVEERIRRLYAGEGQPRSEQKYLRIDGSVVDVEVAASPLTLDGRPAALVTARDITERKQEQKRIARLSRIHAVLSGINSAIVRIRNRQELFKEACRIIVEHGEFTLGWIATLDHATGTLTPVAHLGLPRELSAELDAPGRITGLVPAGVAEIALREKRPSFDNELVDQADLPTSHDRLDTLAIRRAAISLGAKSVISLPLFVEGRTFGVVTLYAPERDFFDEEELKLLSELSGDISFGLEFIAKEEKVDYLAYHDVLTGLPNRTLLNDRLGQDLKTAEREGTVAAVVLADLERFHVINETVGRRVADDVLREAARRLQQIVPAGGSLARVAGDRFALTLSSIKNTSEAVHVLLDGIMPALREPVPLSGHDLRLSARYGIAVYPSDGDTAEVLLSNAETALKKAKADGERFLFYAPEMNARVSETLALENKLRSALEKGHFVLHYQPKIDATHRTVLGLEALIRWNDPELGLVPPANFIPLMEETGLILEAGRWALAQVAKDCRLWAGAGIEPPRIAVNVSPIQLRDRDFVDSVVEAAEGALESGGRLDLEITESVIMENVEAINRKLRIIRGLGVEIAVDDFGTGYSSLAYIARLPITALKIDRSFVSEISASGESLAIVNSVISLAHSLELQVIAEGVETHEQASLLKDLGCDQLQGYLFSRPLPAEEVVRFIQQWPPEEGTVS